MAMAVPMELTRIFIREMTDRQFIELTEVDGSRSFPIVIGLPEAFAIERRLKGQEIPRPQTHDLLASTIRALGGRLREIRINDLSEGTFYARLVIDRDGETIEVDSRPSDAIALGVAESVPILVAEHVLEETQSTAAEVAEDEDDESYLLDDDEEDDDEGAFDWD